MAKTLRVCEKGHKFYKSSDCMSCPKCDALDKPTEGFLSLVHAPVRRALATKGIDTIEKLSKYSEQEILDLHGIGPTAMPILKNALAEKNLSFKAD